MTNKLYYRPYLHEQAMKQNYEIQNLHKNLIFAF
jgi:hypothetical protein